LALWNRKVERSVLRPDHRIKLVKIRIVYPNILHKLELADKACADYKRCNAAFNATSGAPSGSLAVSAKAMAHEPFDKRIGQPMPHGCQSFPG
jgi:hypothetical protein